MAVRYAEQLPPQDDSEHTTFGTACHELAEAHLRAGWDDTVLGAAALGKARIWIERWDLIDRMPGDVAEEMAGVVRPYVDYVNGLTVDGVTRRLEERVTIAGKDCWGSLDCSIFTPFDGLEVIDLKGGSGKCVDPEENAQLLTYAVGEAVRNDWAFDRVRLTIVQPRRSDGRPIVLSWDCTADRVREHHKAVKAAIKGSKDIAAKPVAGDHCHWCVAKALCPAQRERALSVLGSDPGEAPIIQLPQPGALTQDQLSRILQHRKAVGAWFDACGAYAMIHPPAGWKLVEGGSKRRWALDVSSARAVFELEGIDPAPFVNEKLVGIGEAEKLLGLIDRSSLADSMFEKPAGKPSLAPIGDKRPALDPLASLPDLGEDA